MAGKAKTMLVLLILFAVGYYFFFYDKPCAEVQTIKKSVTGNVDKFKENSQKSANDKADKVYEKFFPVQ